MKKILIFTILAIILLVLVPIIVFANEPNLVINAKIRYDYSANSSKVIVSFELAENIDLSQENTNIIIEYFIKNSNGELLPVKSSTEGTAYVKNKSWVGYLNSYDNYPEGERKYSNGNTNDLRYSDNVPKYVELSTQITSSTKIDVNWSNNTVFAIRITTMRADQSGEKVMVYSDGTKPVVEKIFAPVAPIYTKDVQTGIKLEAVNELPANTQVVAERVEYGEVYEKVNAILADTENFIVYEITLESSGVEIQPNGEVRISIPIPEHFDNSSIIVYGVLDDGTVREYNADVITKDGIDYAAFETDHFSTYVLAENTNSGKDNTPGTGTTDILPYAQIKELQEENSEIIGWIEIPETNINYPVMQGEDNEFYLTHNYKKEYLKSGSIFLDKSVNVEKPSTNFLIYGHNRNVKGELFEELINYKKEEYYKEHPVIKFTTTKEKAEYEIIAVFLSRVYYKNEVDVFRYYYFIDAKNEEDFNMYIENCKRESIYNIEETAEYGDQLLTLSTCEYSTKDGRLAVVAKKKSK